MSIYFNTFNIIQYTTIISIIIIIITISPISVIIIIKYYIYIYFNYSIIVQYDSRILRPATKTSAMRKLTTRGFGELYCVHSDSSNA